LFLLTGEAAADVGTIIVDEAPSVEEKFAAIVDEEQGWPDEGEDKAGGAEFPQTFVFLPCQFHARKSPAAGTITAGATRIVIQRILQQDSVKPGLSPDRPRHDRTLPNGKAAWIRFGSALRKLRTGNPG
jgi:hypothetical protein